MIELHEKIIVRIGNDGKTTYEITCLEAPQIKQIKRLIRILKRIKAKKNREIYNSKPKLTRAEYVKNYRNTHPDLNNLAKKRSKLLKEKVLTHYGNNKLECVQCKENRIDCLTIDHINGKGNEHRKEIKIRGAIYGWLIRNNYPDGYQTLCMNCQFVKRARNHECTGKHKNN